MGPIPVKSPRENEVAVMSSHVCLASEAPEEQENSLGSMGSVKSWLLTLGRGSIFHSDDKI